MGLMLRCMSIALGLIAVLPGARADDHPSKPVTIIVPYTPGGSTEILARMVGQKLEERLGKSVVIEENKPDAGDGNAGIIRRRSTSIRCLGES